MRFRAVDFVKKVHTALLENNYQTADELAEKCYLKRSTIYRVIRLLRIENIGVISTKKGYILSEFAKKSDDVGFIRRCYGRRASDFIAIQAALKDINSRWNSISDKKIMSIMLHPLSTNISKTQGMKALLSQKKLLS